MFGDFNRFHLSCNLSWLTNYLLFARLYILDYDDTDFEGKGMGIWSNVAGDDFDWTRHQGFTQTYKTGPVQDHTSGKGMF